MVSWLWLSTFAAMKPIFRNKSFKFPVNTLIGSSYTNFKAVTKKYRRHQKYLFKYEFTKLVCRILDKISIIDQKKYRKQLEETEIKNPPVFIIGFWRSGTTLLHTLFCQNPELCYVTTFQSVFPYLTFWTQRWLKKLLKPILPETRPTDGMKFDFDLPQEEEISLGNMQPVSLYNFFYFPDEAEKIIDESLLLKDISEEEVENWKKAYIRLIKTAMINTKGKCFVSKNPANTFRIRMLLEMFPGARFIYISRDVYHTLFSFQRFTHAVLKGISIQEYDKKKLEVQLIRLYRLLHKKYQQDKSLIPEAQLIELDFASFEKNKLKEMERIYDQLNLTGFQEAMPAMEKYLSEVKDYERDRHLITDEFKKFVDEELAKPEQYQ